MCRITSTLVVGIAYLMKQGQYWGITLLKLLLSGGFGRL
jgi:hypothetical protein